MTAENQKRSSCAEADLELLRRYQNGDETALSDLLEVHYGLLMYWVGLVRDIAPWANRDDLLQEARIGFYEAAEKFDFSRNSNFHTWARISSIGGMFDSREVRRVKRTLQKNYGKVIDAQDELMKKLDRRPTLEELSKEAKLSVKQVESALKLIAVFPLPLDEAEGYLAIEDPYQSQLLGNALNQLTANQSEVIIRRYFYEQEFSEIAKALGKSVGAVKELHKRGIKKLRDIIFGEGDRKDGD